MEIFVELSLIIAFATGVSIIMKLLKQPLVVGYIFAGILAGPYVFNVLHAKDQIELFSKIGITILLFIVGLNLNPTVIRELGKVSILGGLGQVFFTSIIGFLIAVFLGIDKIAALYIAIALTFSSTVIILKLLSDKGDLNKLYGRIAIGFLLVQDIIATLILIFISTFSGAQEGNMISTVSMILAKGTGIFTVLYVVSGYIIPRISKFIASSQELLFLFSLSWGLGLSTIFYLLGFSTEIGALIAGITLAMTPFANEISSRVKPLRDFFIVLFFILLGSQMSLDSIPQVLVPAIILSIFVLIGNPIIVIILMNLLGFERRTGFLAGIAVAQISEFSLILGTVGFNIGHLSKEMLSLITLVGLITIAVSTYFILYADKLYSKLENFIKFLEFRKSKKDLTTEETIHDLILFGYDRGGKHFIDAFNKLGKNYLVVDFNPSTIQLLEKANIPYKFGDAEDAEFLYELGLKNAKLVVSTIPDHHTNILVVKRIRQLNKRAIIIIFSHEIQQAKELYDVGATYVMMPHYLGVQHLAKMINRHELDRKEFEEEKQKHLSLLENA